MGGCCSCFDSIRGGKHGNSCNEEKSSEMTSRRGGGEGQDQGMGISRAMSAPTIQIQGMKARPCTYLYESDVQISTLLPRLSIADAACRFLLLLIFTGIWLRPRSCQGPN